MNVTTKNLVASIATLFFSAIVKLALIAAAIWMLKHGWNGCAIVAVIGAILTGWAYKDEEK